MNTSMAVSISTQKPLLAATMQKAVSYPSEWPIYGGPFLQQTPGGVTVSGGRNAFRIDFTGALPVYSEVPVSELGW